MKAGECFFNAYARNDKPITIVEIGSRIVEGEASLRDVAPAAVNYIGLDFDAGEGVDIVLTDPYHYPLDDASVDVAVTTSCFEHADFFWLSFLEILRVLKDDGICYINAPSSGPFHRYPVDNWRFYPDAGHALANWGMHNNYRDCCVLESYIVDAAQFYDNVTVILKNQAHLNKYPLRTVDSIGDFVNARVHGRADIINHQPYFDAKNQSVSVKLRRRKYRVAGFALLAIGYCLGKLL
jgi:SAM-dependent methyltransferase